MPAWHSRGRSDGSPRTAVTFEGLQSFAHGFWPLKNSVPVHHMGRTNEPIRPIVPRQISSPLCCGELCQILVIIARQPDSRCKKRASKVT